MAEEVIIKYVADTKDVQKKLKEIGLSYDHIGDEAETAGDKSDKALKKTSKGAENLNSDFKKLALTIGSAFALQQIKQFAVSLNDLGLQLEVTGKRMEVVFGNARGKVTADAKAMAQSLGLSVAQFELMATKAGDILVPLGLNRDAAAKASVEIVKLSGALAEFSAGSVTTEQAAHAVTSALTGEREMLKTLGVVLKEEDITARLAAKGQSMLTGEALSTAKAMATLELVTEKSADAQTFFAENAGSATRQAAELKARTQTLREELATKLMPTFNRITNAMLKFMEAVSLNDIIKVVKVIGVATAAWVGYKAVVKLAAARQAILNATLKGSISPIGLMIGAFTALIAAFKLFKKENDDVITRQERLSKAVENNIGELEKERVEMQSNLAVARDRSKSLEDREKALKAVNEVLPEYVTNLTLETISTDAANAALEEYNNTLMLRANLMAEQSLLEEDAIRLAKLRLAFTNMDTDALVGLMEPADAEAVNSMLGLGLNKMEAMVQLRLFSKMSKEVAELEASMRGAVDRIGEFQSALTGNSKASGARGGMFRGMLPDSKELKKVFSRLKKERADSVKSFAEFQKMETALREKAKKDNKADRKRSRKAQADATKKEFEDKKIALEEDKNIRRKGIIDEELTESEKNIRMFEAEQKHLNAMADLYRSYGMSVTGIELQLAMNRAANTKKVSDDMKAAVTDAGNAMDNVANEVESSTENMSTSTIEAFANVTGAAVAVARSVGDEALGLAILEILLNKAVAISQVITGALKFAKGDPVKTAIALASLTAVVVSGFAAVFSVVDQAKQQKEQNQSNQSSGFARGGIMITGDGSSTGDTIPVRISPRESIINAASTRRNFDELIAINNGSFDRLVNEKYILPALAAQTSVTIDGGFNDSRIVNAALKANKDENKRHKELLTAISSKDTHRARKQWY